MKLLLLVVLTASSVQVYADSAEMRSNYYVRKQYKESLMEKVADAEDKLQSIYEEMGVLCSEQSECQKTDKYAKLAAEAVKEEYYIAHTNKVLNGLR